MLEDATAEKVKELVVKSVVSQLAGIELLSQQFPATGARAKKKFINDWARRLHKAGCRPQI